MSHHVTSHHRRAAFRAVDADGASSIEGEIDGESLPTIVANDSSDALSEDASY